MTVTKTHWLHGEVEFAVDVVVETLCSGCLHRNVCDTDMQKRCGNFEQGNNDVAGGCCTCIHRFTRWAHKRPSDDTNIPCFVCRDDLAEGKDPQEGGAQ